MKIKEGFQLREVCGANLIVAHGIKNINFSNVIHLNESATDMWNAVIGKSFTLDDMVKALLDNYDVDEATARKDAEAILNQWKEIGLIEE